MASPVLETNLLGDIYPDVSGELCNKHSKHLSKLKTIFGDIYDGTDMFMQIWSLRGL